MPTPKETVFTPFGEHGIETAVEGGFVFMRIPLDRAKATPSKSGKMMLAANSGSFQTIPGADGMKANVSAGYSAK